MDPHDIGSPVPPCRSVRRSHTVWGHCPVARSESSFSFLILSGRQCRSEKNEKLQQCPVHVGCTPRARVPLGVRSDGGKSLHALTGVIPYCAYRKVRAPGTVQRRRHEVCIAPRKLAGVASCRRGSSSIEELCRGGRGGPCLSSADTARSSRKVNAVFHEKSRQYPRFT